MSCSRPREGEPLQVPSPPPVPDGDPSSLPSPRAAPGARTQARPRPRGSSALIPPLPGLRRELPRFAFRMKMSLRLRSQHFCGLSQMFSTVSGRTHRGSFHGFSHVLSATLDPSCPGTRAPRHRRPQDGADPVVAATQRGPDPALSPPAPPWRSRFPKSGSWLSQGSVARRAQGTTAGQSLWQPPTPGQGQVAQTPLYPGSSPSPWQRQIPHLGKP